ncbi:MAG: ankyrin repeat domain-containing protein [Treponema sp.]|uniref:ankyrin repeat domain-containing protein n=1 Tax=Treponema sp. TaxID=166 RepID=UPI003FA23F14
MKKIKIRLYAAVIFTALLSISCLTTEQSAFLALEGGRLATGLGAQAEEAIKNSKNKKAAAEQQRAEEEKRQAEVAEKQRLAEEQRQREEAQKKHNAEKELRESQFVKAVNTEDSSIIQTFIQQGCKLEITDIDQEKNGYNIRVEDSYFNIPIYEIDTIRFLLNAGIESSLEELINAGILNDMKNIRKIIEAGADLNKTGSNTLEVLVLNKNIEGVQLLLDEGVVVTKNAIEYAMYVNSPDILRIILKNGGFKATTSMLCTAVEYNYPDIVAILIEEGAPVEWYHESDLLTPIMIAALYNNKEAAEVLLKKGASPLSDIWWWSNYHHNQVPLFIAIENDSAEVAELLLKYGAPANKNGHDSGPYYEKKEWEGLYPKGDRDTWVPPLVYAVKCNALKTIPILIKYKADPNAAIERYDDIKGNTALWFAVKNNNTEIVQILIKAGATVTSDTQAAAKTTEMRKLLRSAAKQ